jgi:hypothetical protein
MWLAAAGRYVPPFTYGFTAQLAGGTQAGKVDWSTPPGVIPPTPSGGTAQVVWTSDYLTPSNGQQVVIPSQATLCTISSSSGTFATTPKVGATSFTIGGADHGSVVFNVPPGTTSLTLLTTCTSITAVQVSGVQSGVQYIPNNTSLTILSGTLTPLTFTFSSAADSQVTFSFGGAGSGGIVELSATTTPQAVSVQDNAGVPLNVVATGTIEYAQRQTLNTPLFATPVIVVDAISGQGTDTLLVTAAQAVASGADSTSLIVGSFGLRNYLHNLHVTATGAAGTLPVFGIRATTSAGSDVGGQYDFAANTGTNAAPVSFDYGGALVGVAGDSIYLHNYDSVSHTFRVSLTYKLSNF